MRIQTFTLPDAEKILCIALPTTLNALKSAFRRRSLRVHPDHSVAVDAKEQFQILSAAYEFAQTQVEWILSVEGEAHQPDVCDDGTPLSDLGKGLGPTTNGKPCESCAGKGFNSYTNGMVSCSDCREEAFRVSYRCRKCGGDGEFKRSGKSVGKCFGCQGLGWVPEQRRGRGLFGNVPINRCQTCKGAQVVRDPKAKKLHAKCWQCKGTGELLVFNPVIPKGLLRAR